jgi:hypothetical protein
MTKYNIKLQQLLFLVFGCKRKSAELKIPANNTAFGGHRLLDEPSFGCQGSPAANIFF